MMKCSFLMNIEWESGNRFALSSDTLCLILSNIWLLWLLDLKCIFAILRRDLETVTVLVFDLHSILEPLNGENFIVELTVELHLRSNAHRLWLWEFQEEWIFDLLKVVLVRHCRSGCVQEFEFFMLTDNKYLTSAEAFSNIVKCFTGVGASV